MANKRCISTSINDGMLNKFRLSRDVSSFKISEASATILETSAAILLTLISL